MFDILLIVVLHSYILTGIVTLYDYNIVHTIV